MNLGKLARGLQSMQERAEMRPLDFARFTPPQLSYLQDQSRFKLLRGGNQVGKSYAQCAELIWRCLGEHPYIEVPKAPTEVWLICHSWEQSLSLQDKLWELLPKDLLHPETEYNPGRGFRGKVPIIVFKNGSRLRLKTTNQGSLGVASATISFVGIDEPPPRAIWGELSARVLRAGDLGGIGLTLTPVGRPCGWLQDLAENGIIKDHPAPLTVENVTPQGGLPMLTQQQIDDHAARFLPMDRPQRLLGEWNGPTEGRTFDAFDSSMVCTERPPAGLKVQIGIGIDHGADAGSQVAILCAVDRAGKHPRIWVLDEYTSGGEAVDPEEHARGLLGMLRRQGMTYHSVDRFVGDRKYGGKRYGGKMGNNRLMRAMEREIGVGAGSLPFSIRTAHKPRGSVYEGCSIINECMIHKGFFVDPRCKQLIKSLEHFTFVDNEFKHSIDALRYGAVELITRRLYAPSKLKMY